MAQDFENTITKDIDASLADIRATADSDDAIVGIRLANTSSTTSITVDVAITNDSGTVQAYIIKNAPIPVGSSLELIDGGSKIVLQNGDELKVQSDTDASLNCYVSFVDAISE